MVDAAGTILLANAHAETLFGYPRPALLGLGIDRLVPERVRRRHVEHRAAFFTDARMRAMGAGRDLFARHQDGHEIPVEVGLNPIRTDAGEVVVLATIIDIRARKQAEETTRALIQVSHELIRHSLKEYGTGLHTRCMGRAPSSAEHGSSVGDKG